ncbi:MAG: hypothetical protein WAP51_03820 [Candidatus Sungiibacteriota bacterium]
MARPDMTGIKPDGPYLGGCDKAWPNPGGPKAFDTYDLYPVAPEL